MWVLFVRGDVHVLRESTHLAMHPRQKQYPSAHMIGSLKTSWHMGQCSAMAPEGLKPKPS